MKSKMFSFAALICIPAVMAVKSYAGDPSSFVRGVLESPPETQVRILKLLFDDIYIGNAEALKAKFADACDAIKKPSASANSPPAVDAANKSITTESKAGELSKSKEAVLAGLCADTVRIKIESALTTHKTTPN